MVLTARLTSLGGRGGGGGVGYVGVARVAMAAGITISYAQSWTKTAQSSETVTLEVHVGP
jgi:hypothetical protein